MVNHKFILGFIIDCVLAALIFGFSIPNPCFHSACDGGREYGFPTMWIQSHGPGFFWSLKGLGLMIDFILYIVVVCISSMLLKLFFKTSPSKKATY